MRYWSPAGALRLDPDGSIPAADVGRTVQSRARFLIWPPADGWPDVLAGSALELELRRGFDPIPRALTQACILVTRQLYGGYHTITTTAAMWSLIHPWRSIVAPAPAAGP